MATLFTNIKSLVNVRNMPSVIRGRYLKELPVIDNAYLIVEDRFIADFGKMSELEYKPSDFAFTVDVTGKFILPSWCDSHTHLVFAAPREAEFVDKINGLSYQEIAAKGGGILSSAKKVAEASEDDLYHGAYQRLQEIARQGTGAVEIKSGYGLTVEGEIKMLRVISRLKQSSKMMIKATFLGAHAIPEEFKNNREGYIKLILEEMLPVIAAENLADFIDVFCEEGFFTPEETVLICKAGATHGLKAKIHANQLSVSKGVQAAVAVNALSADHLESMDEAAISALAGSNTIGTLLPSAAFFLRMPYQPARTLLNADCTLALASDYNPGSSPSGNMNFVVALSCIQMRMLPEEAINAATLNGAYAMQAEEYAGSITIGKFANLILTKEIPSLAYLPYSFGTNNIDKVMLAGEWVL
ncbi:MAG TPA: imidazolonepropionase [Chitinophagaceae bacterium]|nr:imidazolonepropionase [Chitinophagaceae bacterium]